MERNENYLEEAILMMLQRDKGNDFYDTESIIDYINEQKELNKTIPIKCWRKNKNIPLPTYAHNGDACCDLYAQAIEYDAEKDRYIVHTGLHIALDEDYVLSIRPRSSFTKTEYYIANTPCTIDEPYRGEIMVVFKNRTNVEIVNALYNLLDEHITISDNYYKLHQQVDFPYKVGDKIAQILVHKRTKIEWQEVDKLEDLGETDRGATGFGDSGR